MKIAIYTLHIFESLRNHWVLMPYPRFVHLSACDIFLDKCVAKKMVTCIYYLMDYDKLRPRLRSSWVHFKLCRCTCSDAPLRNQVLSISSQIATLDLLKQYHVALRHFNWWFVFWVFPFIHIIVEGVTFLGTLLFKQQARKNFSPLSLSKGVHGTWFYRANTEKELSVNHEVNWGINARLARCLWQQIASICENTQNVSNINVLCRIHHRNV